uniref:ATP synthase F0 subunit 8 n=1 Tax=Semirhynchia dumbrodiana TaxID=3056118 RepID=UPI003001380B|nr:ATP synthase F0 subunit 8 [Semirhynchia dumbrodiana]
MPQMSPLSWWMLMIFFILMLMMICIMNYYITIFKPIPLSEFKSFKKNNLIWKW